VPGEEGKEIGPVCVMIFIIVSLTLVLDQLTKFFVVNNLTLYQSIPVFKNILYITFVSNRGAAFGMFKNQVPVFVAAALAAIILILVDIVKTKRKKISLYDVSLALILAGAIGNLIDRLRFGYVVDFLDFRVWPVFNVADSAITVGAILLGWTMLFSKPVVKDRK